MSHDDRLHTTGIDPVSDWSLTTWYSNPLFRNWMERPDASSMKEALLLRKWEGEQISLWALRAALMQFHWDSVSQMLADAFDEGLLYIPPTVVFSHPDLRTRFLRDLLHHSEKLQLNSKWSERLAKAWPWLWWEDAQSRGMGESHPFARLIRADHCVALETLWKYRPASEWLNWSDPKADKMVSVMMRTGSPHALSALLSYDPSLLHWRHTKDQKTLLHEACSKLRPELAEIILSEGIDVGVRSKTGLTVAHEALAGMLKKTQKNILNQKKSPFDPLEQLLMVLGKWGLFSKKGLLPEHQVLDELLLILDPVRLSSMRSLLQRIALSYETSKSSERGDSCAVRRL